jgi:hypothetical protein
MSEFMLKAHLRGFKIKEIPVNHLPRRHGASMFSPLNLTAVTLNVLKSLWTIRRGAGH